jgi:protocatechuate 3,4-dioxygenase beta subunit
MKTDAALPSKPRNIAVAYRSTEKRAPSNNPILVPAGVGETSGPIFGHSNIRPNDSDLTRQHVGEPQGERIIIRGRVTDDSNRPVPESLIEIWQTNAAGRYIHTADTHDAPLDPNFSGGGRTLTDGDGIYQFTTIKPGAYPWGNHTNAWRPAHIHFSLFGHTFVSRIVTQMYFPGDPLLAFDPILQAVSSDESRRNLVAEWDSNVTKPGWALGYKFNIVLSGPNRTHAEG